MAIMRRYGPRTAPMVQQDHPADHFTRALGTWTHTMQIEPADYLGHIYEEQAVANSYAGQFFSKRSAVSTLTGSGGDFVVGPGHEVVDHRRGPSVDELCERVGEPCVRVHGIS